MYLWMSVCMYVDAADVHMYVNNIYYIQVLYPLGRIKPFFKTALAEDMCARRHNGLLHQISADRAFKVVDIDRRHHQGYGEMTRWRNSHHPDEQQEN
jgi:hypothetical protein